MKIDLPVHDFSTLSGRGKNASIEQSPPKSGGPITLIVDFTGLKIHRGSEWCEENCGTGKSQKSWRKLHVGLNQQSGEVVASLLTTGDVGDETALPELIANIDTIVSRALVDEAYDGRDVFKALTDAFGPDVEVIIPPPKNGAVGLYNAWDAHIRSMAWQKATGYNDRALVEAQFGCWKQVIGDRLKSRNIATQITEVRTATKVFNRIACLDRAAFERV